MKEYRIGSFPLVIAVLSAISMLFLVGCPASNYGVRYEVEVTKSVSQEGVTEPAPSSGDGGVEVEWLVMSSRLKGEFSNPGDTEMKILWEGAVFSYDGESEPLIVTRAQTPNLPQPPTKIPPNSKVEVGALPLSCAKWRWFSDRSTGGFWYEASPLLGIGPTREQSKKERQQLAETAIGQQFDVRIPIQLDDKVLVHEFHFRIIGANAHAAYY
jgi:hypothetical protein